MLAETFAQFGVILNEEKAEISEESEEKEFEMQLPNFNTVENKAKRIIDCLPDFSYLI